MTTKANLVLITALMFGAMGIQLVTLHGDWHAVTSTGFVAGCCLQFAAVIKALYTDMTTTVPPSTESLS